MSIDRLRTHYGFTKTPFGKDLAPGMLHCHDAHAQAVARIQWCIQEQAIGVISGECGAGKTVSRPAPRSPALTRPGTRCSISAPLGSGCAASTD